MCYIAFMRKSKKYSKKKRRVIFGILFGAMAAVIGGLGYTALYMKQFNEFAEAYDGRFFEGTSINGIDVTGMTVDEVEAMLEESAGSYAINIKFRNGEETIPGEKFDYHYVSDGTVEKVFSRQDARTWFDEYMKNGKTVTPVEEEAEVKTVFDAEMLLDAVRALPEMQDENMTEPADAYMDYVDNKFVVVPESDGTELDKKTVLRAVLEAADKYEPEVDVTAISGVYAAPAKTKASVGKELQEEADALNEFTTAGITYTLPSGEEKTLDGTITKNWLSKDDYGNYYRDQYVWGEQIRSYVQSVADMVDTVGITRTFDATDIGEVEILGGNYGYQIDVEAEIMQLTDELYNGTVTTREPVYVSRETASGGNHGLGDDYVEVDCSRQHMWIYIDGEVALETDVVTGMMTDTRATPQGVCLVYNKALDYTLIGQGNAYRTPVSYWMPFNGAVGFHDAWWRSAFGGDIYLWDGSHGCVNMPVDMAAKAFDLITFEMPIVVYYS